MAIPLLMLGPGGDYVTRFESQGHNMVRSVGHTRGQSEHDDTESGSSLAGYVRYPKRNPAARQDASGEGDPHQQPGRDTDRFEPTPGNPALDLLANAAEGSANDPQGTPAIDPALAQQITRRWVRAGSLAAAAAAIEAWLHQQSKALAQASAALRELAGSPITRSADPAALVGALRGALAPVAPAETTDLNDPAAIDPAILDHAVLRRALLGEPLTPADDDTETSYDPEAHPQTAEDPTAHPRLATDPRLFPDLAGIGGRNGRKQGHHLRARRSAHQEACPEARPQQGSLFGVGR